MTTANPAAEAATAGRGTDYARMSRAVRQAGLMDRRTGNYAWRIAITVALLAGGWAAFILTGNSWWQLALAVFLAVMFTQVGFLGHDAGHRQICGARRLSYVLGLLLGNLGIGLSFGWWVAKHNRHHANPNTEGADPDVMLRALAMTSGQAAASRGFSRILYRCQAFLFFPMLLGEAFSVHAASIRALLNRDGRHRWAEAALLAAHFAAYLTVVFLVLSPVKAVVFILVQQGLFGIYLGASFAPNHKGMPILSRQEERDFLRRQVLTFTEHPRQLAHRPCPGRAELPDRASPIPVHAPPEPAPVSAPHQRVLPPARAPVCSGRLAQLVRPGAATPAHSRRARLALTGAGSWPASIGTTHGLHRGAEPVLTSACPAGHLPAETARTSTSFTIFESTSEIQRMIIGRAVTGLDV